MWYRNPGSETHSKQGRASLYHGKGDKKKKITQNLLVVAGKLEPGLYTEPTIGDKEENMKVKIFTVSLGIEGQDTSEMLLPGIIPETLE